MAKLSDKVYYVNDVCNGSSVLVGTEHRPQTNGLNRFWCEVCGVSLSGAYVIVGKDAIKEKERPEIMKNPLSDTVDFESSPAQCSDLFTASDESPIIIIEGFDSAILGYILPSLGLNTLDNSIRVVYSFTKMVTYLMSEEGYSRLDAVAYIESNYATTWVGVGAPVIVVDNL